MRSILQAQQQRAPRDSKSAQRYIRKFYSNHQNARRLHYMLWEKSYVWNGNEAYTVRVYYYLVDDRAGIQVFDKEAREELYSEGPLGGPARVDVYTALPSRHVYERMRRHASTARR